MKTHPLPVTRSVETPPGFPDAAELAVLRAWHAGLSAREAVERYLDARRAPGQSSRGLLGRIRRQLAAFARRRQREDLATLFEIAASARAQQGRAADQAIELLRALPLPEPVISDEVGLWLEARAVTALRASGIETLADLTVRVPRRRRWWAAIPGLGQASARRIEAFFAEHPQLTERARALIAERTRGVVVPWEQLRLPHEVDGSEGQFRAPRETCVLTADNDYEAVQAWLSLHESPATQRAYRKEAERLILWAIIERGRPLSSLTTEDAIAYRGFLRRPTPHERWVGPARPRASVEWRPFTNGLSARSIAYSLSVLGAMFRWLIQQRYVLANPFAGIKVRGGGRTAALDASHAFTEGEWALARTIADGLEWSYGWEAPAAQRLRFVLDFAYATGLRASELIAAKLGGIETDRQGDHWLNLIGKGSRAGKVALPPLARTALDRYLVERGLPVTRARWNPRTPLIGALGLDPDGGITGSRLWSVVRRFFWTAADIIERDHAVLADKLRKASPHWMRHTHASHALARGAELTTVRDNLRHASISTTSIYLHGDDVKRARQIEAAFVAK
ncbi:MULTISPECIES: phage integrase family protein [Ralstonia solanacearum species complex]|uniref:phage integrase family protein n=1 Tax=Ralstonia solanacearum species complex TaxID=3116862 RepID=UPI000E5679EE|nr:phage integrase family protein [Ralstonia solanacearum]BEU74510.1 phage integrase family protein [Ralstonia pseudosolanacearum]AXV79365.1 integrase [Ralstonia solanacearum]AXV93386.1 integrase [Ralstonia solanacearum]AXW21416.1 integrase [Ralstonia solanacearum]AXW78283.1 integrase [Ralstonia solanacearum]